MTDIYHSNYLNPEKDPIKEAQMYLKNYWLKIDWSYAYLFKNNQEVVSFAIVRKLQKSKTLIIDRISTFPEKQGYGKNTIDWLIECNNFV